ncbi:protein IMPACT-A-like isoform X2 [Ischnura elegans]|uniref:protein IMPACT-A-like isoform X2 n=1 Tax=Ischnura elegans TaxID=197161 RepID=UPI001ED8770A|nr:protein IMPACT-A-like isoform X2 [Ischnura elegans]
MEDNLTRQVDEIEALTSIYNDLWKVDDEASRVYSMKVEENGYEVTLFVTLPPEYPSECPPIYQLSAPWLKGQERQNICVQLEEIYLENIGESVLFQWIEKLRDILQSKEEHSNNDPSSMTNECLSAAVDTGTDDGQFEIPTIFHGETITDRRSVFQGHVAVVFSVEQVRLVLSQLYQEKKIANATHNIYAYRILKEDTKTYIQDCEDDGETHAGGRLLHLLQVGSRKCGSH